MEGLDNKPPPQLDDFLDIWLPLARLRCADAFAHEES